MARKSWAAYKSACMAKKQPFLGKGDYQGLDGESYEKAVEGLDDEGEGEGEGAEGGGEEPPQGPESEGAGEGEDEQKSRDLELLPGEEELLKSMELLAGIGNSGPAAEREAKIAKLSAKAAKGMLAKSERDELRGLLTDEATQQTAEPLGKSLREDPRTAPAFEASEFLQTWSERTTDAVDRLTKSLVEAETDRATFQRRLALGLDAFAKSMVLGMAGLRQQVAKLAAQPVAFNGKTQAPRLTPEQIQKSRRDGADLAALGKAGELSKARAENALGDLMEKAAAGDDEERREQLAIVLSRMAVRQGDWRNTPGMTPALAEEIVRAAVR